MPVDRDDRRTLLRMSLGLLVAPVLLGQSRRQPNEARRGRPAMAFIGDSITQMWQELHPAYFPPGRINRGIGGQTSAQIRARMAADVIAHRPRIVHILAGTNDVAGNGGPMTADESVANLAAMARSARAQGIFPLIGTVPPANVCYWRPQIVPGPGIHAINRRLRALAAREHLQLVDYFTALADRNGGLRASLSDDGVHPNLAGYRVMERQLNSVLARLPGR